MKIQLSPARFRFCIQLAFSLFCIYIGFQFTAFLAWALGQSAQFVTKPGAVEGFLPISALLGFRQLAATGIWDAIHPAGLAIFIAILSMTFLFRKGFCGYICPVGFLSNLLERVGRKIHMARIPHKLVDYPLLSIKYGLTGFFIYTVFFGMSLSSIQSFISSPYNMVSDAKMLEFFTTPSTTAVLILSAILLLSLIVRNAWCRYLCPYGALLGIIAWFGPMSITRNTTTCIDCGKCTKVCPSGIAVQTKKSVRSPECIGCAECIGTCPVDRCLTFSVYSEYRMPWLIIGIGAVAVLLTIWAWATLTGHWDATVPPDMLKRIYSTLVTTK